MNKPRFLIILATVALTAVVSLTQTYSAKASAAPAGNPNLKQHLGYDPADLITISVVSNGRTGSEWVKLLEKSGGIDVGLKSLLLSDGFKPTLGMKTDVFVVKASSFKRTDSLWVAEHESAARHRLAKVNPELLCLLLEALSSRPSHDVMLQDIIGYVRY